MSRYKYIVLIEVEDAEIYTGMEFDTYKQAEDYEYCMNEKYSYREVTTVILNGEKKYYSMSERWLNTSLHAMHISEEQWKIYVIFLRDVIAGFKHEWFMNEERC